MHGFAVVRLNHDGSATAEYYEGSDATAPMYRETL
jgi:hypothetical protein